MSLFGLVQNTGLIIFVGGIISFLFLIISLIIFGVPQKGFYSWLFIVVFGFMILYMGSALYEALK